MIAFTLAGYRYSLASTGKDVCSHPTEAIVCTAWQHGSGTRRWIRRNNDDGVGRYDGGILVLSAGYIHVLVVRHSHTVHFYRPRQFLQHSLPIAVPRSRKRDDALLHINPSSHHARLRPHRSNHRKLYDQNTLNLPF